MDVLMISPKTFGNAGFVARCMKNFGAGNLAILAPRYEVNDDIHGFAMHGRDVLDEATIISCGEAEITAQFAELARKYELVVATTARPPNRGKLHRVPIPPRDAAPRLVSTKSLLVLGREDTGMTDEEMKACDVVITIPGNPEYPTMNVSHAAAIVLYECWLLHPSLPVGCGRHFATVATEEFLPASREARVQFHEWFENTVFKHLARASNEDRMEKFVAVVKNVLERAGVTTRELSIMSGFLRKLESSQANIK